MINSSSEPVRSQRGAAAVELTLLVPALVLMLGLLVAGGRLWFARTTVNEAAQTAARAASLTRSAYAATTAGLRCRSTSAVINATAFGVPAGMPSTVTSTISCVVDFSDVLLPGWPGSMELTGRGSAALDTYRGR